MRERDKESFQVEGLNPKQLKVLSQCPLQRGVHGALCQGWVSLLGCSPTSVERSWYLHFQLFFLIYFTFCAFL